MIDWNDNAKEAVKRFAKFTMCEDAVVDYFLALGDKPKRKTVKDAVEGDWSEHNHKGTLSNERPVIGYSPSDDLFFSCTSDYGFDSLNSDEYMVGTLAEFEAEVERQKGEEWTHETYAGKCKIVCEHKGVALVEQENGQVWSLPIDDVRIIKPTISKSVAEDVSAILGIPMERIEEGFNVS